MKTNLHLLIFSLIAGSSATALAENLCTVDLRVGGGMTGKISEFQAEQIRSAVEAKQYTLSTTLNAIYKMRVTRSLGFNCMTGVSAREAFFNVPAGYRIDFHGPDLKFEKNDSFEGIESFVDARSFRRLMKQLRNLPFCPHAE